MKICKSVILFLIMTLFCNNVNSQTFETITLRPGPEDGYDAEVRTDMNHPISYEDDFIANAWTVQGMPFIERSLIRFDLSSIPNGVVITNARLSLFCNTSSGHQQLHSGYNSSYLLPITSDWNQDSLVWDNQPTTTLENAVLLPQTQYQTQDYPNIDVTSQISYFYNHPELNYGFMLKLVEEVQLNAMIFSSSNHVDPAKRPLLVIEYTVCETPDPAFSYTSTGNLNEISFISTSNNNVTHWWDFGNGFYSDLADPLFVYQISGKYHVCHTVMNACDTTMECDTITVCDLSDIGFTYKLDGNFASFTPDSVGGNADYVWDFGDGFYSYLQYPMHYYNELGNYKVCLTVSNECNSIDQCDSVFFIPNRLVNGNSDEIVRVYPNPTFGELNIVEGNVHSNFNSVRILNMDGLEVLNSNDIQTKDGKNNFRFNLLGLQKGVYVIQVKTDKGIVNTKTILLGN